MAQSTNTTIGLSKAERILRALEKEIVSGKIANGDRLESENRLMQRFSVSRNTIRKSLNELARQGLITKRSGVGSFVTYDGRMIDDTLGWTRTLSLSELEVETQFLAIRRDSCSRVESFLSRHRLILPRHPNDYLRIDRIRRNRADGSGLSLERSRLPWRDEFQSILDKGLMDDSISKTLEAIGIAVLSGKEWAWVVPELSEPDAGLLQRKATDPMLQLCRITCDANAELIEYVECLLDPARFSLHLSF